MSFFSKRRSRFPSKKQKCEAKAGKKGCTTAMVEVASSSTTFKDYEAMLRLAKFISLRDFSSPLSTSFLSLNWSKISRHFLFFRAYRTFYKL